MSPAFRARIPAFTVAGLLHALFAWLFLNAMPVEPAPKPDHAARGETTIALLPPPVLPSKKRLRRAPAGGSTAVATPYFNPYAYSAAPSAASDTNAITVALSACDPGRTDMASLEVRVLCNRIGMALKNDPGHFGVTSDVADPKHWQQELARREAPHLLPCMKAHAPPKVGVDIKPIAELDLATLLCISRILFVGYDSRDHEHYSQ